MGLPKAKTTSQKKSNKTSKKPASISIDAVSEIPQEIKDEEKCIESEAFHDKRYKNKMAGHHLDNSSHVLA